MMEYYTAININEVKQTWNGLTVYEFSKAGNNLYCLIFIKKYLYKGIEKVEWYSY